MMEEKSTKTASISEGLRKAKELATTKTTFGFAAAFFIGGGVFVSAATYDAHPASVVALLLGVFCMWSASQEGSHIDSINREIGFLESEGEKTSQSLYFYVNESLIKTILP